VERKVVRRVKPLLSELQVPEWQELAKDRRKWEKMLESIRMRIWFVLQVQGVGSFAQRYHVDQPRTQIKRKGNSGDDLHRTAGPGLRYEVVGGGAASQQRSRPPQRGAFAQHERGVYKTRQDKAKLAGQGIQDACIS
jgi:hypothetical protein